MISDEFALEKLCFFFQSSKLLFRRMHLLPVIFRGIYPNIFLWFYAFSKYLSLEFFANTKTVDIY